MSETNNVEVLAPSATMSLERAAIDSQIATAHAYPRSMELFKKRAIGMVTLDIQTAESCIYSRPVGGGKVAEGESIRMAEIVAASYGNLRVAARIVEQTPRYVKCEGVAHDLESNYAGKSECIEPTVTKSGEPYSEAQRAVVAKACLSKAYRDAVFKVVPKALCKSVTLAARGVINKEVATIEQRQKRVKEWLKQIKIEDARVFSVLNVKGWSEVTDDHLTLLTGLKTAINEGDTTIGEAFPEIAKAPVFSGPGETKAAAKPEPKAEPKQPVSTPQTATAQPPGNPPAENVPVAPAEPPKANGDDGDLGPQGAFVPTPGESDAVQSIRVLMHKSGINEYQFISWATENKIARGEVKLIDFTTNKRDAKLLTVAKSWDTILPALKQQPQAAPAEP